MDIIADGLELWTVFFFSPVVVGLPGVEEVVIVGMNEVGEDDPFGDLGTVDARGGGEGDTGGGVNGGVGDMVRAGGGEVNESFFREKRRRLVVLGERKWE